MSLSRNYDIIVEVLEMMTDLTRETAKMKLLDTCAKFKKETDESKSKESEQH